MIASVTNGMATEYELRESPISVGTIAYDKKMTIAVNWGAVSESIPRSAEDIIEDRKAVRNQLTSPETLKFLMEQQQQLKQVEIELGRKKGQAAAQAYVTLAQEAGVVEEGVSKKESVPIPEWVLYLPQRIFSELHVGVFDARSPKQRNWAIACRKTYPQIKLFVLGWDSMSDLDGWIKENPSMSDVYTIATVKTKDKYYPAKLFADKYGIQSLPARVQFPDRKTEVITYGFSLEPAQP